MLGEVRSLERVLGGYRIFAEFQDLTYTNVHIPIEGLIEVIWAALLGLDCAGWLDYPPI